MSRRNPEIKHCLRCWRFYLALLALVFCSVWFAAAADTLSWHKAQDRVDADVRSLELSSLLEQVAAATGWQVFLDPGAAHVASAKFKNLSSGEALHVLLGNLNFALIPKTNGPSQLYVFRTSQRQATRLIRAASKKAVPISNQLIVTLKPGAKTKIDDLARALHAKIIGRMDAQNAYLLQFQDADAAQSAREQLVNNPDVASVDVNYPVDRPPSVETTSGSMPDLQLKPKSNDGNCQLVVGLIDTPVEPLTSNLASFMRPAIHVAGTSQINPAQITHGTAMAETILQTLQKVTSGNTSVQIQPVDVYGNSESTTTFDVANGIVQAVNSGANVLNLSLGSTGDSQILHNTINQVLQQGIPVYAAAGNEPVTTPTYPAAYPGVVAVTATDPSGNIAPYANRGSFITMAAPGDNVVSYDGQNFLVEGTSTSTAFASGMAAGLADNAHDCADQAESLLQKSLKSIPKP